MNSKPKCASTPSLVPRLNCRRSIGQWESILSPILFDQKMDASTSFGEHQSKKHDRANQTDESLDYFIDGDCSAPIISDDDSSVNSDSQSEISTNIIQNESEKEDIPDLIKVHRQALPQQIHVHHEPEHEHEVTVNHNTYLNLVFVAVSIGIISLIIAIINSLNGGDSSVVMDSSKHITMRILKESFPEQDDSLWASIESGVSEINDFEKPSVIILMYKDDTFGVTTDLLDGVIKYASCILNKNCSEEPISLIGKELNTYEATKDYGIIIEKYKLLLEQKRIMVVHNMEEILGTVAQAFHTFCDEYTPLVKKSLFIFTIKVDEYYERALRQAVDILEDKWSDIDPEKLEPLIARVTSVVLQISKRIHSI